MTEPFVSVVTPVYNDGRNSSRRRSAAFWRRRYQNFEYIICNNHSTDNSGEIAARYAALDSRIRVVNPRNSCRRHRTSTSHSSKSRPRAAIPK